MSGVEQENVDQNDLADYVENLDAEQMEAVAQDEDGEMKPIEDLQYDESDTQADESNEDNSESEQAIDDSNGGDDESDESETEAETEGPAAETAQETPDEVDQTPAAAEEVEEEAELTPGEEEALQIARKLAGLSPKIVEARGNWEYHKDLASKAKKELDKLHEKSDEMLAELQGLDLKIIEEKDPQQKLPFEEEHPDVADGKNRPHGTPALETVAKEVKKKQKPVDPAKEAAIHDLAKPEIVGDVALTETVIDRLMDASIQFIAQLEERIRKAVAGGWSWHKEIERVGTQAATKIEEALEAWRKENPVPDDDEDEDEPESIAVSDEYNTVPVDGLDSDDSDEEAETPLSELTWYCMDCHHRWEVNQDRQNSQCPECHNTSENAILGFHNCQDAKEDGEIVSGLEAVDLLEESDIDNQVGLECSIWLYERSDGYFTSGAGLCDTETEDEFYQDPMITNNVSPTREAELFFQAGQMFDEVKSIRLEAVLSDYRNDLAEKIGGEWVECTNCQTIAIHKDPGEVPCRFCAGEAFVSAD